MPVTLRPWQPGDEAAAVRWSQDRTFCDLNGWTSSLPPEQVRQWWQQRGAGSPLLRMILKGGQVVGYAEWQDLQGGTAELGIAPSGTAPSGGRASARRPGG